MAKKFTEKQVMEALQNFMSSEPEDGGITYRLYIDEDGKIVDSAGASAMSFSSKLDPRAYENSPKDYDWRDDVEAESNPYFMEVVRDLTKQANDCFEE